ncbi:MAG: DUF3795 domain-containing protein [Treponema sp.]|nr:DUF3795 domain-containing protein [Treponema sp.]
MNADWSNQNKIFQALISKESTFSDGIKILLELRASLFEQITQIVNNYPQDAFWQFPFSGVDGNHGTTMAWSIWHLARIEDICVHELVLGGKTPQIFLSGDWQKKIGAGIITTGNELDEQQTVDFSKAVNIQALYKYALSVMEGTNSVLRELTFADCKKKFSEADRTRLVESKCVSDSESSAWLIDYWCGKNVAGLLKMPFSRHWIMHVEAMQKIKNKLCKMARKGTDPIAYCGFSCNHCFLGQWCGGCRSKYNTCSFATCFPDRVCPNTKCCNEKGYDGCWECDEIKNCTKGFYIPECDGANAAKAQALFVGKYGKKEFLKVHDKLHEKYDFAKTQEILEQDLEEGLKILEENR